MLFAPGDVPVVYALHRGRIMVLSRPAPDIEVLLSSRHPGELIGELSLVASEHVQEARAATAALVTRIDIDAFRAVLKESQPATFALAILLGRRAAIAESRMAEVAVHSVKRRLMFALRRLARETPLMDSRGSLLPDWLTRDDLARMIGATRENVSRSLSDLVRERRVLIDGRRLIVPREH